MDCTHEYKGDIVKLKTSAVVTGLLFISSLSVYLYENRTRSGMIAGSDFIKGFDASGIEKMELETKTETISFLKDNDRFLLESHKSYPASTAKINDFIYKIAGIRIKEKVTDASSEKELDKYQLNEKDRMFKVTIFDKEQKETLSFYVGKNYKGKGNYLYKKGRPEVYLSQERVSFSSSHKNFIDKKLISIKEKEIDKIIVNTKRKMELFKKKDKYLLKTKRKFKEEKVKEYFSHFENLKFKDYFRHNEKEVVGLRFDKTVEIRLKNKLIYKLTFSRKGKKYFVKINALLDEMPKQIVVEKDDGDEKLAGIQAMVDAQAQAQRINLERSIWVYLIDEDVYKKLIPSTKTFF